MPVLLRRAGQSRWHQSPKLGLILGIAFAGDFHCFPCETIQEPIKLRSIVGLIPLFAVEVGCPVPNIKSHRSMEKLTLGVLWEVIGFAVQDSCRFLLCNCFLSGLGTGQCAQFTSPRILRSKKMSSAPEDMLRRLPRFAGQMLGNPIDLPNVKEVQERMPQKCHFSVCVCESCFGSLKSSCSR